MHYAELEVHREEELMSEQEHIVDTLISMIEDSIMTELNRWSPNTNDNWWEFGENSISKVFISKKGSISLGEKQGGGIVLTSKQSEKIKKLYILLQSYTAMYRLQTPVEAENES